MTKTLNINSLKLGETLVIKTESAISQLINICMADGTIIECTITNNTPCTITVGRTAMQINSDNPPEIPIEITRI